MTTPEQLNIHLSVTWILESYQALTESRFKGTPRPWKQSEPDPRPRHETPAEPRNSPQLVGVAAFTETPAPLHLDVLDQLQTLGVDAKHYAVTLAYYTGDQIPYLQLTTSEAHKTPDLLRYVLRALTNVTPGLCDDLLARAARDFRAHRLEVAKQFSEIVEGQRLRARCPWCLDEQLRFRFVAGHICVRCESGICEPGPDDCGTWDQGRPCWPMHEWEWLAHRIDYSAAQTEPI